MFVRSTVFSANKRCKRWSSSAAEYFPGLKTTQVIDVTTTAVDDAQYKAIYDAQIPVVLKGYAKQWPCIGDEAKKWSNLQELKKRVSQADSIVSIEVGNHYMDPDLQKHKISLESYLDFLIKYENITTDQLRDIPNVYLAQHDVQDVAIMKDDLLIPDICTKTGKGNLYRSNIWFSGPRGSISPCHYDPFQNILIQVFGEKEVWLMHPKFSDDVYPAYGTVQKNTSLVDFEHPDEKKFPRVFNIEIQRAILQDGDALFMPFKWWHYCKTRTTSCSVNFWWL